MDGQGSCEKPSVLDNTIDRLEGVFVDINHLKDRLNKKNIQLFGENPPDPKTNKEQLSPNGGAFCVIDKKLAKITVALDMLRAEIDTTERA